jgi:hypothetical protein
MDERRFSSVSVRAISVILIGYWSCVLATSVCGLFLAKTLLDPQFLGYDYRELGLTAIRSSFAQILLLLRTLLWINIPLSMIAITSAIGLFYRINPSRYLTIATISIALFQSYYVSYQAVVFIVALLDHIPNRSTNEIWITIIGSVIAILTYTGLGGYLIVKLLSRPMRLQFVEK